jgi:hypothetical protein
MLFFYELIPTLWWRGFNGPLFTRKKECGRIRGAELLTLGSLGTDNFDGLIPR